MIKSHFICISNFFVIHWRIRKSVLNMKFFYICVAVLFNAWLRKRYSMLTNKTLLKVSVYRSRCNAGICSFEILSNGDVVVCTYIRNSKFIEVNVRERSFRYILDDWNSFAWRRNMTVRQLKGKCGSCKYAARCLGGCRNVRLLDTGDIYRENRFCAYHAEVMLEI